MVKSGWEFPRIVHHASATVGLPASEPAPLRSPFAFFFDGVSGRTMILTDPLGTIIGREGGLELKVGGRHLAWRGNPLDHLEEAFETCARWAATAPSPHRCFAGAFHYDLRRCIEPFPWPARDESGLPWVNWTLFGHAAFGNEGPSRSSSEAFSDPGCGAVFQDSLSDVSSSLDHDAFCEAVRRILRHERAGDVYQVNLTRQVEFPVERHPFTLWLDLARSAEAPLSAYLDFADLQLLSLSPERFLRREGDRLWTQPIKGTSPRGATAVQDAENLERLLRGEKEAAELAMIVDVQRNDLGRLALPGGVRLSEHRRVITLPNVHHLCSCVEARLRPGIGVAGILRAAFPGGSVTGAPKIRAMQIIDELEPVSRGYYCGALGWMDLSGDFDWSLPIRTGVVQGRTLRLGTGGGIVVDSDPQAEWEETVAKARCFLGDGEEGRSSKEAGGDRET